MGAGLAEKPATRKAQVSRSPSKGQARHSDPKLNTRQQRFVEEYAKDANGTAAYIRAGYSKRGAAQSASLLLSLPKIRVLIDEQAASRTKRVMYDADEALADIIPFTKVNIQNFIIDDPLTPGGHRIAGLSDLATMDPKITAQVRELKGKVYWDEHGNPVAEVELKLHDPLKGVALAGKHKAVQAFVEKPEVVNTLAERMEAIQRERFA